MKKNNALRVFVELVVRAWIIAVGTVVTIVWFLVLLSLTPPFLSFWATLDAQHSFIWSISPVIVFTTGWALLIALALSFVHTALNFKISNGDRGENAQSV